MRSNLSTGFASVLPFIGLVVVGVIAVTTAMTVLGFGDVPSPSFSPTPSPAPSLATYSAAPTATASEVVYMVSLPPHSPSVKTQILRVRDPHGVWTVNFSYPQLVLGTTPLAHIVNQDIAAEVQTRVEAFENGEAQLPDGSGGLNSLAGTYTLEMLSNRVASFTLRWTDDTGAKAQPAIGLQALTYALNSARRLDFGDVFIDQPGALNIVSADSRTQLQQSLGSAYDSTVVEAGTTPLLANFQSWSLTPAGLKVTFYPLQVADYESGTPTVVIPWRDLATVVRPDGPTVGLIPAAKPSVTPSASKAASPSAS
jgi:hypothetical protein